MKICIFSHYFLSFIKSLIYLKIIHVTEDSKFISDTNEEFACALLFEHVRAFQMQKNSQSMDCFSLAIQVYNLLYIIIYIYICLMNCKNTILSKFYF